MKNPFSQLNKMRENIGSVCPVRDYELLLAMNQRANELQRQCDEIKKMNVTLCLN